MRRSSLIWCVATLLVHVAGGVIGADTETIVFTRESNDSMGLPNMILERIQADGSGRTVIFDSDVRESPETTGLDYPHRIYAPKWQRSPDVSPLGKKIAVRRSWTISVMNWDGSDAVNVTPYRREWFDPKWSSDGTRLALCTDIRDLADIYVMNADGSGLKNLTWKGRSSERSPDWSPDSRKITFISNRNGKFELFTMNAADGTEQVRILSLDGDIREPSWGENNRIAFSLQRADGNSALYVVDPDGSGLTQLTDGAYWDGQAAWAADGKRLAFTSNRSGVSDIWVLDVASGEMRNVTRNPENNEQFPTWVPTQISDEAPRVAATEGHAANTTGIELPRPRLLFRAEDLPGIREKLAGEPYAPVWTAFLARCDRLCDAASKESQAVETAILAIPDNPSRGLYDRSGWITPIFDLAFAWQVTGERKYGERGAAWLVTVAEEYAKWHQAMVFEYPTACSYDWLYSLFAPEELKMLNRVLQTTASSFFRKITDTYFGATAAIEGNFATHDAGSMGPAFLALTGESGSDAAWLPAVARLTTINLNTWIGEAGDAAEGTSYFNYPVALLMPFMVSLKVNDLYPETRESNLQYFGEWLAVVNAGGAEGGLPAIGDSDGGRVAFSPGLLRLYPENATIRKLWNGVERPERPSADVLSLLWFEPSEGKAQDFTGYPRSAYFTAQNYQVFRSGYNEDSLLLTFTLTAGGHAHKECGAITLHGYGQKLLVDPGQAVHAADCHSQLLINGEGRYVNYETAGAEKERIAPIQSEGIGVGSSVEMPPAFASRQLSTHSAPTYGIPGPGMKIEHGSRSVMMIGDDTSAVPPYVLVFDDVKVSDRESLYEQLYIADADVATRDNGDGSFVLVKEYAGPWLSPVSGAKGDAAIEFDIATAGNYQVWVYMKGNPESERTGAFAYSIGEATFNVNAGFRSRGANNWQWAVAGDPVALGAGKQVMRILPRNTIFAKVALIPEAEAKEYRGWAELPESALRRSCTEAVVSGDAWSERSAERSPAELLVASLNTDPVSVTEDAVSFHTRFHGQQFITLPRTRLVKRQPSANFLTLLYPYLPEMEKPGIQKGEGGAVLTWKAAVDTIRTSGDEIVVVRKHRDNREEVFRYQRPGGSRAED